MSMMKMGWECSVLCLFSSVSTNAWLGNLIFADRMMRMVLMRRRRGSGGKQQIQVRQRHWVAQCKVEVFKKVRVPYCAPRKACGCTLRRSMEIGTGCMLQLVWARLPSEM